MAHEVDNPGYPVDPHLRQLEFSLGNIAAAWRSSRDPQKREQIRKEYWAVIQQLYALGWDAELDLESLLPDEYKKRRPFLTRHSQL